MNEFDKQVLHELVEKGYIKNSTIAKGLGVSERTVKRSINKMRDKGLIKIVAIPNPLLLGYEAWAKIGIKTEPGLLSEIAHKLISHPSVYFVAYAIGKFDIIIAVHFYKTEELIRFVNLELLEVNGILATETMILSVPRKYYDFHWSIPQYMLDNKLSHGTENQRFKIDENDKKILDILMEDGLAPPSTIRSTLGLSEATIRKHMKNMLANGVYKIRVVPNLDILEYSAWATIGITTDYHFEKQSLEHIIQMQPVYLVSASLGRYNLIVAVNFNNHDVLNTFVKTKLQTITGINTIDIFLHNKPLKYHNVTWADGLITQDK